MNGTMTSITGCSQVLLIHCKNFLFERFVDFIVWYAVY